MTADDEDLLARRARAIHARSLDALSPRVRTQLQWRLRAAAEGAPAARRATRDWRWAAAPALALALALGLPRLGPDAPAGADSAAQVAAAAAAAADAPVVPLEQDPEFYAWLGSADALALVSE